MLAVAQGPQAPAWDPHNVHVLLVDDELLSRLVVGACRGGPSWCSGRGHGPVPRPLTPPTPPCRRQPAAQVQLQG
jgi:hypothetical protein